MGVISQRLLLLSQVRAVPGRTLAGVALLLVVRILVPAATALATGALVGRLVQVAEQPGHGLRPVLAALAGFVVLLLVGQVSDISTDPVRLYVTRRVDDAHRRAVERVACAPAGIAHLEDARCQDELLQAAGDPDNWTESTPGPAVWSQLLLLSRYAGAVLAIAVIARDTPLGAALLTGSMWVFQTVQRRGFLRMVRTWVAGMPHRRRAEYWTSLLTGARSAKEVRVFGLSDWMRQRYLIESNAHLQPFRAAKLTDMRRQWAWLLLVLAATGGTMYQLGDLAVRGELSIGRLSGDLTVMVLLLPLMSMSDAVLFVEAGMPRLLALRQLRERLITVDASRAASAAVAAERDPAAPRAVPRVRFTGVRFAYPGAGHPRTGRAVLNGLDLEIRPGEVLALVGLNGAGKSTIIKLLAGLYEPDAGRVTVDGVDLREIGAVAWRRRLAVVFQDFLRYELSAWDNIALGAAVRPGGDADANIRAAAAQAGVAELIDGLPHGWATPLSAGRGGVDLSGGQWQRIALARALLAVRTGAAVLVLDEPTAHLDVRAEFDVFRQVIRAASGASVVLISHRLSTVREADRIVLIDDGRVAESGSHDELLAADGTYAHLFRLQARQFRPPGGDGVPEPATLEVTS